MGDNYGYLPLPQGFATAAIHYGQDPEQWESCSVVPPIVTSTIFKQSTAAKSKYVYGRSGNPSRSVLEECLANLEGGKHGLCFASGLGAITAVLSLLKPGDHIVCVNDVYVGTYQALIKISTPLGIGTSFVDATDANNVEKAILPTTKLIWAETITNPTLKVLDIKAISQIAKKHKILLAVDNTFLTPYFQKPLELGVDIVIHSLSKYVNGHSDVIMGAVVLNNTEIHDKLRFLQNAMGSVPSPFDCSQVIRSLKTLAIRMKQHSYNSLAIAKFLESHPKVEKVIHPGLPSHPQHDLFKKQTSGHSGMVAVYIKGNLEQSKKLLNTMKILIYAKSLGGTDTTAQIPFITSHALVPEEQKKALNVSENLIRLSVGLEDVEDLINDFKQAFNAI